MTQKKEKVQSDLDCNSRVKKSEKKLNDDYIIIYDENRISDSIKVTFLPN